MPRPKSVPSYRIHKQSGQAIVTLTDPLGNRRDMLLGKHGTPASRQEYARIIAEWEANGRQIPMRGDPFGPSDLTVNELLLRYWQWAEGYYRDAEGKPALELENIRSALKPLRAHYGHTPATLFGPNALRALQGVLSDTGLSRSTINNRINRIRRVFKWGASHELVPVHIHQALQTVPGLRRGQSQVREADPVKPVPVEDVEATLPHLPDPVAAMVRVQLLTGCRPGEAWAMRALDINMCGSVWVYRPRQHKNSHRGLDRVIYLGPKAQEVIRPFLTPDLTAYLFSPRDYVKALHARRATQRKTKRTPSELAKRKHKPKPKRQPGELYNRRSYRLAITRACKKAGVPAWSPLQLRHTAATEIRARYGVEAAKVILGHTRVETSQIYAERDLTRAEKIMAEVG